MTVNIVFALVVFTSNPTSFIHEQCAGIVINAADFEKSIDYINDLCVSKKRLSKKDLILSVRVYNTLTMNSMIGTKEKYKLFYNLFSRDYLEQTVKGLGASLSKGMGFYSKRYDIHIGGEPHAKSIFCIQ
jgi:hypothetical protein